MVKLFSIHFVTSIFLFLRRALIYCSLAKHFKISERILKILQYLFCIISLNPTLVPIRKSAHLTVLYSLYGYTSVIHISQSANFWYLKIMFRDKEDRGRPGRCSLYLEYLKYMYCNVAPKRIIFFLFQPCCLLSLFNYQNLGI